MNVMETTATSWLDLWEIYCPERNQEELNRCDWLQLAPMHAPSQLDSPVEFSDQLGQLFSAGADENHRKLNGQFFTPPGIARFMASWSVPLPEKALVMDPGAGTGILIAALAEHVIQQRFCGQLHVVAYETDRLLTPALALALGFTHAWLKSRGVEFSSEIILDDFILGNAARVRTPSLFDSLDKPHSPHLVIANPPYFKLSRIDPRAALLPEVVHGQPNIYSLFMATAAKLLEQEGQLIFITPRSFCSGPYFRLFRKWFFRMVALQRLHIFESRTDAFNRDKVLQENVILAAQKNFSSEPVQISTSYGASDLAMATSQAIPITRVLDLNSREAVLRVPLSQGDDMIQQIFASWEEHLSSLGLKISTGPIVPFRTDLMTNDGEGMATAPVLWLQHVGRMAVTWPLVGFSKPQQVRIEKGATSLLLPNANYVLVRRFSPKEENSRITAAPCLKGTLPSEFLGIENHLNYICRPGGSLTDAEAVGLAAFLNCRWVDQYIRLASGNTQVSATELRNLPFPPLEKIVSIGRRLLELEGVSPIALINQVVGEELNLSPELSVGGLHMSKIEEAKDLLKALGMPPAQRNEIAALTLLALAGLSEDKPWHEAQRQSIRIHDIISFIQFNYHKRYAENTRETFRRQVLHQFEQARLVDLNPDDPTLPTNSPRTHYAISEALFPAIQNYGTRKGQQRIAKFIGDQGTLLEMYQRRRIEHLVPLMDESGHEYHLSPGKHNQLQVQVVEQFAPRFAPGSRLLYLGDTAHKTFIMDTKALGRIGFPVDRHSKLPDIILYWVKKNWLFLIEVVTAHGPVSPKRHHELEKLLSNSSSERVYVSVFPDFKEYLRHARDVAWETEIWIAEAPDHLIHYNGSKFLGPPRK